MQHWGQKDTPINRLIHYQEPYVPLIWVTITPPWHLLHLHAGGHLHPLVGFSIAQKANFKSLLRWAFT